MTPTEQKETQSEIPDWAVHISHVYSWGKVPRSYGGELTRRTIQWYSSSGLIPSAKRIGKEAYYNRHDIFSYLRSIEILNRRFGLLLSEIRKIIRKAEGLEEIVAGVDEETAQPEFQSGVQALSDLLEAFLEYEKNEQAQCSSWDGDVPVWTEEQAGRLERLEYELIKRLKAANKETAKLLQGGLLNLEEELFPHGKMNSESKTARPAVTTSEEEVPF